MLSCHTAHLEFVSTLSDTQLMNDLRALVEEGRRLTARLLIHIAEVDARKLYLEHACSSMHVYCVERLHMSDPAAYRRIHAARAARRFPRIFDMVAANELHLSAIALLSQHLSHENQDELLTEARHKSKRQIEQLLANRFPRPDAPEVIRRLPRPVAQRGSQSVPPPSLPNLELGRMPPRASPRALVAPTAPERYRVQFAANATLHDKLREAQALLRHQVPSGDVAEILERALDALLAKTKKKRFAATDRPRKGKSFAEETKRNRHIPNAVKRAVVARDGGQCTFVDTDGNRCGEISLIEFHHVDAYALGGAHTVDNIALRCAPHNRFEAEQEMGRRAVAAKIQQARDARDAARSRAYGRRAARRGTAPF